MIDCPTGKCDIGTNQNRITTRKKTNKPEITLICNYHPTCNGTGNCEKCTHLRDIKIYEWK